MIAPFEISSPESMAMNTASSTPIPAGMWIITPAILLTSSTPNTRK
ncbi:hypothetical protein SB00610_02427 [Klebsiella quasipneumoniae subsp. similipneumoniae]|nr:hypothetical protein SB00610_02427 [Klebsiella quasipneumoniae subsp. similipneumoniae]